MYTQSITTRDALEHHLRSIPGVILVRVTEGQHRINIVVVVDDPGHTLAVGVSEAFMDSQRSVAGDHRVRSPHGRRDRSPPNNRGQRLAPRSMGAPVIPHVARDLGCRNCGGKLGDVPTDDAVTDLFVQAANEFARKRNELLPRTGICPSVCSARRCLYAARAGNVTRARQYLASAIGRDPGHWDRFAALIDQAIEAAVRAK